MVNVPDPKSDALAIVIGGGSYQGQLFVYDPAEMVAALVNFAVPAYPAYVLDGTTT